MNPGADWALLELARRDKADLEQTMKAVTEAGATTLGVARCSVWRLLPDKSAIVCQDLYRPELDKHTSGDKLFVHQTPTYFRALLESRAIDAHDARRDPRTSEYLDHYLGPLGITSMMDVPIWHRGELYGVLCNEHLGPMRTWRPEEVSFAGNLADVLSISLEASERIATERRWQAVVGAIAEAVLVTDAAGNVVLANPAAHEILDRLGGGYSYEERLRLVEYRDMMGRPLSHDRWPFARARQGEVIQGEIVCLVALRTGRKYHFRVSSAPLYRDGRVASTVCVFTDVSEEMEIDRLKREFLGALAHELKTPVAITKGYAQMLEEALPVPESSRPMLDAICRASDRMESLIADLMDVASIAQGRLALQRTRVDLGDLARTAATAVRQSAPRHGLLVVATEPVHARVDPQRMERVVLQLLENAVRYSPGHGRIEIVVRREDARAVLRVRDQGIGIPAERQDRIFEPFYRAHAGTPHDVGGVGIGLYLARQIAIAHGGDIRFESAEGLGSTFELQVPLAGSPGDEQ